MLYVTLCENRVKSGNFGHQVNSDNIQLMHSLEVNIRICQPENSSVHRGEAEVNITFEG